MVIAPARWLLALAASVAFGVVLFAAEPVPVAVAEAEQLDARRVAQVKAAYVLNFIRYTEWPPGTRSDEYVVTVVGRSNLGRTFEQVFRAAKQVNGRPVVLRRVAYPEPAQDGSIDPAAFRRFYDELANTHVLYVGGSERARLSQILARVGPAVLTVSDVDGFAAAGGMVELVLEDNRIVFEANAKAIDRGGLRVSSKAMKLARAVHGEPGP